MYAFGSSILCSDTLYNMHGIRRIIVSLSQDFSAKSKLNCV
jgi:hypothetical protein